MHTDAFGTPQRESNLADSSGQGGKLVGGHFYKTRNGRVTHTPRLWKSGSDFAEFISLPDSGIHSGNTVVSSDGQRLAAYAYHPDSETEFLRIYELPSVRLLHELDVHGDQMHDSNKAHALEFSPDGRHVDVCGDKGASIQIWNVQEGRMLWEEHPADIYGVNSLSFFPDGRTFAYAAWYEPLEIRDTMTQERAKQRRRTARTGSPQHRRRIRRREMPSAKTRTGGCQRRSV